jgi:cell pole-organizing protein PopZ
MTIINGASHHNVEDILASIRTSIAGEGSMTRPLNGEIQSPGGRREQMIADEAADFELPAIFKPGHHAVPERQRLLGRLSEALKHTNPADSSRPRTVIPFDPSGMRPADPQAAPQATMQAAANRFSGHQNGPRPQSYQAPEPRPDVRPEPRPEPRPETKDVKRVMPTFFDTRISKLGEMSRQAYQAPPEPPRPQHHAPEPPAMPRQRLQPMLPEGNLAQHSGSVDDAAAQLLRPMLRQWLEENMPKIVEKALLSEAQGTDTPPERK